MEGNVTAKTLALLQLLDDSDPELSSSSSSSSHTDSDLQRYLDVAETLTCCRKRTRPSRPMRNFCEEIVPAHSEKEFVTHFRISRKLMYSLVERFTESEIYQALILPGTRASISAYKHILAFLWFAGHQTASFRDVAERFDISLSSMHDIVTRVITFLSSLAVYVICWPTPEEKTQTMAHYEEAVGFQNIIGSICVSHIKLDKRKPAERGDDYVNRLGYPSMILQGVCNEECKFIDIFVACPGSVHDNTVFKKSPIYSLLPQLCEGGFLLGHSAYPSSEVLMTPYRDTGFLTDEENYFNTQFSTCHISMKHTFLMLKQRFRQLFHLKIKGHERICLFIKACCVLHNLADQEDLRIFDGEVNPSDEQPLPEEVDEGNLTSSSDKRYKHQLLLRLSIS